MQLKDVAVLITGGGSGLGAATARAMAAKGAKIGVIDQSKENAEKVAAEVKGVALHADVTDEEAIKAAIAKAEAAHGVARVLDELRRHRRFAAHRRQGRRYPLANFARIINVNLIGTFNVCACSPSVCHGRADRRRARRHHQHRIGGRVEGQIGQIAYSASKGGVVGLTLPMARDLASRDPRQHHRARPVLHAAADGLPRKRARASARRCRIPSRLGDASEYGSLAVHIVENPMLNGETIRLDGAIRMAPR